MKKFVTSRLGLGVIGVSVVLLVVHIMWASMFWTKTLAFFQLNMFWIAPLTLTVAAAALCTIYWNRNILTGTERRYSSGVSGFLTVQRTALMSSVFVIAGGALALIFLTPYWVATKYVPQTSVTESVVDFEQRTPYPVAHWSSQNALGDLTGGEIDSVKYTAANDGSEYTFLVRSRGLAAGYKAVVNLDGSRCNFNEDVADRSTSGWFNHKLGRLINKTERGVIFSDEDVYGYCEDDVPMVIVPLKQVKGLFPAYQVPAGIAVYNGETGQLDIHRNVKAGDFPGPVYPQSIAAHSRDSLRADGSWWDYMRDLVGYTPNWSDAENPNGGNVSEYGLRGTNGEGAFVTPLVANGGSTAIVALGVQPYGSNERGVIAPYEVKRYPKPQVSNGQAASVIRATFSELSWQNGMTIFEMTPTVGVKRVATLGLNQAIQYRVEFDNETYTLTDSRGKVLKSAKVNDQGEEEGTTGEIEDLSTGAQVKISDLTDEELIQMLSDIAREQQERVSKD